MLPLSSNNYTDDTHMHRHARRDANTPRGTYASSPKPTQGTHMTLTMDHTCIQSHTRCYIYDKQVYKCTYRDTHLQNASTEEHIKYNYIYMQLLIYNYIYDANA